MDFRFCALLFVLAGFFWWVYGYGCYLDGLFVVLRI